MLASFCVLTVTMLVLGPTATAQLPAHETLKPVENGTCGPLDPVYQYPCRMVFWGVYGSEHQVFCSVIAEFVPPEHIFGQRMVCEMPEEPSQGIDARGLMQVQADGSFGAARHPCNRLTDIYQEMCYIMYDSIVDQTTHVHPAIKDLTDCVFYPELCG